MRTLFYNTTVYQPKSVPHQHFHSFVVENGKFADFFVEKEPKVDCDEAINLNSMYVYPPFFDSHTHFVWGGSSLTPLNFHQVFNKEEIFQRIRVARDEMEKCRGRGWLIGLGLDPHRIQITREELDYACGNFPCIIDTHDLHSAFANRIALERAEVWELCQNPEGGVIERDEKGVPTGWLREFAVQYVKRVIPVATSEEHFQWYKKAEALAHSLGIVGVGENANTILANDYKSWDDQKKLFLRVNLWLNEGKPNENTLHFPQYHSNRLRIMTQKMFFDGSLGSQTAFMKEPYENQSDCGMPLMTFQEAYDLITKSLNLKWEVAIHCIGDAAVEMVLDLASDLVVQHYDVTKIAMEHCQVLPENAISRIKQLGLIASMQPVHLANDRNWMRKKIGVERCRRSFQFRQLSEEKIPLRFGSDWPVEELNPILGLKIAIEDDTEDHPEKFWYQQNQLTFDLALDSFTRIAHQTSGWKQNCQISFGKNAIHTSADFIILNCDLQNTPTNEWNILPVVQTWLDGECLFAKY